MFLDCKSENDFATSEPHHRWSVGGLYDNVNAHLAVQDRQWMGSGHGWAGANYVLWNCEGSLICQKPPTAQNWAIGCSVKERKGTRFTLGGGCSIPTSFTLRLQLPPTGGVFGRLARAAAAVTWAPLRGGGHSSPFGGIHLGSAVT